MHTGTNSISPSERVKAAYAPSRQPRPTFPRLARYTQPTDSSKNRLSLMGAMKKNTPGMMQRYFTARRLCSWL